MAVIVYLLVTAAILAAIRLIRLVIDARAQYQAAQAQGEQLHLVESERAQLAADNLLLRSELERIGQKRHTHATTEMLEDLASALLDIDIETKEFYRYICARLKNADKILSAGRPGPYSYTPATTESRPARPGAAVKLWTQ